MFTTLVQWLSNGWDWLSWIFRESWRALSSFYTWWFGTVMIFVGWIWFGVSWIDSAISAVASAVDAWVLPSLSASIPGGISAVLALANTFFPVQETFTFMGSYLTLVVALFVYRLIKSWLPTLGS